MQTNSRYRPISPNTDSALCSLLIKGKTIHGHYIEAIRDAASLPELHGYLRQKYKWTKDTSNTIAWPWFKTAANNYQQTDNHLMKLVYDQLPTRYVKNKKSGQSWVPETCQFCGVETETFEHLLKCNHIAGAEFRKTLPRSVRTYCEKRRVPYNFQVTLIIAIEDWLRQRPPLQNITNRPAVLALASAQHKIGWSRFFKGFLTTQWKVYFDHEYNSVHHQQTNTANPFDVDTFFSGLIQLLWTKQSQFWLTHQHNLHAPPPDTQEPIRLQELRMETQQLFQLKSQVPHRHRETYFPHDMKHFLNTSTISQLQAYISNYKPSILHSIATQKQRDKGSKPIDQFPGFQKTKIRTPCSKPPPSQSTPPIPTYQPTFHQTYLHQHNPEPSEAASATNNPYSRRTIHQHLHSNTLNPTLPTTTQDHTSNTQREKQPRKHTKWRASQTMQDRFKAFFRPPKPTPLSDHTS